MARVTHVKKARASRQDRSCATCRTEVRVGESYKWIDKKTGPTSSITLWFCKDHNPKGSHLASGRTAELLTIVEGFEESIPGFENLYSSDFQSAVGSLAEEIKDFTNEIEESAQAIEDGLGHATSQSENMNETVHELRAWGDEIEHLAGWLESEEGAIDLIIAMVSEVPDLNLQG